ncbi:MAG: alginate lyase family protein [Bryobacteraceae bacterium]
MRSVREIGYRLRQELTNLRLFAAPPRAQIEARGAASGFLPDGAEVARRLAGAPFAAEIEQLAREILSHEFPVFGSQIKTGPSIDWRLDYKNGKTSGTRYFRLVPYLDVARAGDHKWIWELNRHQHLVVLAQAFLFSGDTRYLREIENEILDWLEQNPFQRGINWASALEVAFRAMSWAWVMHLAGPHLARHTQGQIERGLYLHSLHLENNLSIYFSPNTHLLGEAVALHALGALFPHLPNAARARETGRQVVRAQIESQVRADGSHFEQSTYYHVYALDMFLFHAVLEPPDASLRSTVERMAEFLSRVLGAGRRLPFLGDDDGGRWFHPYGERDTFGRATLACCNAFFGEERWPCEPADYHSQAYWWLHVKDDLPSSALRNETPSSTLFPDSGLIFFEAENSTIILDAGPMGTGSAGHSHADALSLTACIAGADLLIDPGTFTYVGNAQDRSAFRGTAAHNTVRIDGLDQAEPAGPFRWTNTPRVRILRWDSSAAEDVAEAECSYRGFEHWRCVRFLKPFALLVVDCIRGPGGEHLIEQFWHLRHEALQNRLAVIENPELISGWRSRCFGQREAAPVMRVMKRGMLPVVFAAGICLTDGVAIDIESSVDSVSFQVNSPSRTLAISVICPHRKVG